MTKFLARYGHAGLSLRAAKAAIRTGEWREIESAAARSAAAKAKADAAAKAKKAKQIVRAKACETPLLRRRAGGMP